MFTHVVLFDFHDPASAPEARRRMLAMEGKVPALASIEVGLDELPSPRSAQLCLITRFASAADYEAYAVDPVHKELLAWVGPLVARAVKVDWAG